MNKKLVLLFSCVIVLLSISGCETDNELDSSTKIPQVFYEYNDQTVCMEALLEGTLQVNDKGCLVIVADKSEGVPLWWDKPKVNSKQISLPDGTKYKIGDKIKLGGGGISGHPITDKAVKTCDAEYVWQVCGNVKP